MESRGDASTGRSARKLGRVGVEATGVEHGVVGGAAAAGESVRAEAVVGSLKGAAR